MVRTLLRYIGDYKKDTILTPVFTALEVVMQLLIPFVTAAIIDEGVQAGNMSKIYFYGAIMVGCALLSLFFGIESGRHGATASTGFAANLRVGMYRNIQTFSFSNIDKFSTAGLITRLTTDVTNVQNAFQMILRIAVRAPLTLFISMIMCFMINARLSLIFLVAMIFLFGVLMLIVLKTMPIFRQVFARYDDLNASVQENVSAIRVVKAFVREDYENEKFNKASQKLYDLTVKAEALLAFNNPVMMLTIYGCIVMLAWFGAHYIVIGTLTTGSLTSLFSYVITMMMSLMMLSMIFVMISMSIASAGRIAEVLSEQADLTNGTAPLTEVADGRVDFDHVDFVYNAQGSGDDTLHDIDLHIKSGEMIGVIGGTGCGKTSFVNLISRLYDVKNGSVKVGGVDVRDYDLDSLRREVAVVLQKNVLFSGTILDNLRWGKKDATLEECKKACALACADEFIERLPDGYNTWIEQGGTNVSGGQRQRLCIARAIIGSPKVLILDDSTSAVDTATDAKIKQAFAEEIPETTKIIVSQRVSSIEKADRILVLEDGRISGFDTHENLLKTNEIYREIYEIQMESSGDFDSPS